MTSPCATTPPRIHAHNRNVKTSTFGGLVIARNTLDLETLWVSEALLDEIAAHPMLEQVGALREMGFDGGGNLTL